MRVIRLAPLATFGALGLAVTMGLNVNDQGIKTANCCYPKVAVNDLKRSALFSKVLISIASSAKLA
jgi:hypothetical protein